MSDKKKVFVFSLYDSEGPSSKYRIFQYLDKIREYSDVKISCFWPNIYTKKYVMNKSKYKLQIIQLYIIGVIRRVFQAYFIAPKYDVVIIQKAMIPKIKNTFLSGIKKHKCKIIFDVDDAVYLDSKDSSDEVASECNTVFCGSDLLLNHYRQHNKNAVFIPTVEDDRQYKLLRQDTFDKKIIGWIGTSINLKNLEIVIEPVNHIIEKHPEVSFHLICDSDGSFGDRIKNFKFIKWEKCNALKEMAQFTIGIMPLEDNDINRGKCGFKLIQYMTMGKPVIGSPVGENKVIIGYGGIAADNAQEWENAFENMLFDRLSYNRYCEQIQNKFLEDYSFEKNCEVIKKFICL